MREIKFRGMDLQGRWHYGLVTHIQTSKGGYAEGWYISNAVGMPCAYPVRPETVSQYTGLKDKNGKEIYEGDIVQVTHFDGIKDKPEEVKWSAIHDGGEAIGFGYWDFTGYEIIGNIYSNPELLQS